LNDKNIQQNKDLIVQIYKTGLLLL